MTRRLALFFAISSVSVAAVLGVALIRHGAAVADSDARWRAHRPSPLKDIGTTKSVTILPLLDWHAARDDLRTDVGVAYLVKTDDMTILFDVGNNTAEERPSPLEHNMAALDVELDDVDTIGRIVFHHRGTSAGDFAEIDDVLQAVLEARRAQPTIVSTARQ